MFYCLTPEGIWGHSPSTDMINDTYLNLIVNSSIFFANNPMPLKLAQKIICTAVFTGRSHLLLPSFIFLFVKWLKCQGTTLQVWESRWLRWLCSFVFCTLFATLELWLNWNSDMHNLIIKFKGRHVFAIGFL